MELFVYKFITVVSQYGKGYITVKPEVIPPVRR